MEWEKYQLAYSISETKNLLESEEFDILIMVPSLKEDEPSDFFEFLSDLKSPPHLIFFEQGDNKVLHTLEHLLKAHELNLMGVLAKPVSKNNLQALLETYEGRKENNIKPVKKNKSLSIEELQEGLEKKYIIPFYQPKVEIKTGNLIGVECLARWIDPEKGMVFPDQFIPIAEQSGLIREITKSIFVQAMNQAAEWLIDGLELKVSVNASMADLEDLTFSNFIIQEAQKAGVSLKNVVIEITETQIMKDVKVPLSTLAKLRNKEVGVSIDDYGTGFSGLKQLSQVPANELKVDREFVYEAWKDKDKKVILKSSLEMARALEILTVGEGAETIEDWELLEDLGCDLCQGYFCAKPMEGEQLIEWYENWQQRKPAPRPKPNSVVDKTSEKGLSKNKIFPFKYILVTALAGFIALFIYPKLPFLHDNKENVQSETFEMRQSIAVLPFVNMSSDLEQSYFSDGVSEEILNVLAQVPRLLVTSRSSSFQFRGTSVHIPTVADSLGVDHILEGSVRKFGSMVRVTAQLIDAKSDSHIWSETFEREMDNIFAIQDEIAGAIAAALKIRLIGEGDTKPSVIRTDSPEAYNNYLLGRHHFEERTVKELELAQLYFEKAIEMDPSYAPAYNGLADTILFLSEGAYGSVPLEQVVSKALPLIQKSMELDPTLAETHASLGFLRMFERDYLASESSLKRAIELSPNFSRAYNWLYITQERMLKPKEAFETLKKVFGFDPLSRIVNSNLSAEYWIRGENEEALRAAGRVTQLDPESPLGYRRTGRILWTSGKLAEAVSWYAQSREVAPDDRNSKIELGTLYSDLGFFEEAESLLGDQKYYSYLAQGKIKEALDLVHNNLKERPEDFNSIFATARVEMWAGNYENTLKLLEPLTLDIDRGKTVLFRNSGYLFWDPQIGALDLALARLKTGEIVSGKALLSEVESYFEKLKSAGIEHSLIKYQEARVLALKGENEEALSVLKEAVNLGWSFWYLESDPAFESLKNTIQFREIAEGLKSSLEMGKKALVKLP